MFLKHQRIVVSWTLFLLEFCVFTAASVLYEGDFCDFAGYAGTCLPVSKCFHLQSIMQELELKSYNVGRCGFTVREELICCPKWPTPVQTPAVQTPPALTNEFIDFSKGFVFPTPQGAETMPPLALRDTSVQNISTAQNDNLNDKINAIFSGLNSNNNGILKVEHLLDINGNENSNGVLNENTHPLSANTNETLNQVNKEENLDEVLKKIFNGEPAVNANLNQDLRPANLGEVNENINEIIQNIFNENPPMDGNLKQNAPSVKPLTDEEVNERIKYIFDVNPAPVVVNLEQSKHTPNANQALSDRGPNVRPLAGNILTNEDLNKRIKNIFNLNTDQDEILKGKQRVVSGGKLAVDANLNRTSLTGNTLRDEIRNENTKEVFNEYTVPLKNHKNETKNEFNINTNKDRFPNEKSNENLYNLWGESSKLDGVLNDKWIDLINGSSGAKLDENNFPNGKLNESVANTVKPVAFGDEVPVGSINTNSFAENSIANKKLREKMQYPNVKMFNEETSIKGNPWLNGSQFNVSTAWGAVGKDIAEVQPSTVPIGSEHFMPNESINNVKNVKSIEVSRNIFEENLGGNKNEKSKPTNSGNESAEIVVLVPSSSNGSFNTNTVPVGDITVGSDDMYVDKEFQGTPSKYEPSNITYSLDSPPPPPYGSATPTEVGTHKHEFERNHFQDKFSSDQRESTYNKNSGESANESSETRSYPYEYNGNSATFEDYNNNGFFNKSREATNQGTDNLYFENQFNQPYLPHVKHGFFPEPPLSPYDTVFNGNANSNTRNIFFEGEKNFNPDAFRVNSRHRDLRIHDAVRDSALDLANRLVETKQEVIKAVNPFRNYVLQLRNERRRNRNQNRNRNRLALAASTALL